MLPLGFSASGLTIESLIGTQVVFWTFTFPVNQVTENWTVLPANWTDLRSQWEYSHATSAALNLIAFIALALAWVDQPRRAPGARPDVDQP